MTASSTTTKVSYSGNGSTTVFAYGFKIFADADLRVIERAADGTETVKSLTTHYTVSGAGTDSGGNVTFGTAPASGVTVIIKRNLTLTQGTDYVANDPFPAESHEEALDRLTFIAQGIQEELDRTIKASETNTISGAEFTVSATDRANKIFAFDSSGDLSVTQELGTFRGNWAASTAYAVRDLVKDTSTNNIFIVNTAHTSSGAQPLTTNANSAKYDLIVDAASATTSATNAASSATAAASSATAAANSATASATAQAASETAKTASETAKAAAETALTTFQGQYHGAASSDPTSNLDTGDLYFNTSTGMKVYTGSAWVDVKPSSSEQTAITAVNANASNINALAATDVLADMALLADADVISDMNILATTDVVADLNTLATSDIVSDINTLATSDIVSDLNTLATSDIVSDINTLATSDIVSDLNTLATSDFVSDLNTMATSDVVADLNTLAAISSDITSLAGALEKTYTVTVANVGGVNVFLLDGANYPAIEMFRGNTYIFNLNDSSVDGHPLVFKNGSSEYDAGVTYFLNGASASKSDFVNVTTFNAGRSSGDRKVQISVQASAPSSGLRYYCYIHGNAMGNTITVTDSNISLVATNIANVNLTGGSITNVNSVAGAIANVNTLASNISGVNSFAERYRVGSSDPTSSLDEGDLAYNSTSNQLKYYDGSAWQGIAPGIASVSADSTPQLGGDLDVGTHSIVSASNRDIAITPNGNGDVIIDGLKHPQADGSAGQFLKTDGNGQLSFATVASDVVSDSSPQLGADLDLNNNNITGTGGLNFTGSIVVTGTVDGRDVAADGTKLDGIEAGATADQTAAEIRALVAAAGDSNVFTDALLTKLNGIAAGATNVTNTNQLTNGAGFSTFNGSYTSLTNRPVNNFRSGDQKHAVTSSNRNLGGSYVNHISTSAFTVPSGFQAACFMSASLSSMYESNAGGPAMRFHISGPNNWYSPEHRGGRGSFNNYTSSEGLVYFQQGFNAGSHTVRIQCRTWQGSVTLNEDGGYDTLTAYWTLYQT